MAPQSSTLFDSNWIKQASKIPHDSWASDAAGKLNGTGGIYLNTLRLWFDRFPFRSGKQRKALKSHLESFKNADHLGGVNELCWWEFQTSFGWDVEPIFTQKQRTPDFQVKSPELFFCEVTTLNVSDKDKTALNQGGGVPLDHSKTIGRILKKITADKHEQLAYGASIKAPSVLILFDYTTWSGFATQFCREIAKYIFGQTAGFRSLPVELSVLVYVERKVIDGRIVLSKIRSGVFHNPNATYRLSENVFCMLRQHWRTLTETPPAQLLTGNNAWFWL